MRFLPLLPVACFATVLGAQSYTVTPAAFATTTGTSSNTYPLYAQLARYQQVHGDVRGTPRVLRELAIRKGSFTSSTSGAARTIDCTLLLSDAAFGPLSPTFATNYAGTPTTVKARGTINLPSWSTSQGTPEPWSVLLPFSAPYPYPASKDLLWELLIHSSNSSNTYFADTAGDYQLTPNAALGTGCIASGQTNRYSWSGYLHTSTHDKSLRLPFYALYGPLNSPTSVMVGVVNPDLTVPGLCEKLFVLPLWSFPGVTNASGRIDWGTAIVTHDASWVGAQLFVQAASVDAGQAGLPFALSNGRRFTVSAMSTLAPAPVYRVWNLSSDVAATGSLDTYGGYGLIVRLAH
jgi:hypothetical protein